jgi:hypothetical protein
MSESSARPASTDQPEPATLMTVPAPGQSHRLPLVVEALGYLGALIAIVAAFVALHQFWPHVPPGAGLAFTGVVAVGLLAVGAVLRTDGEPAFGRLRSVMWLISTAGLASFVSILTDQFLQLRGFSVLLLAEGAWTMYAVPLWWRHRTALQQLAMFAGTAALVGTGINRLDPHLTTWGPGLGIWILAALWGVAVYRGYLVPRAAGFVAACTGLLFGAQLATDGMTAGDVLALVTVAGLLAAGIALRRVLVLGFGAVGAIWIVPQAAARYLPGSVVAPLAVAVVGLLLLAIAIWLAKTRRTT